MKLVTFRPRSEQRDQVSALAAVAASSVDFSPDFDDLSVRT